MFKVRRTRTFWILFSILLFLNLSLIYLFVLFIVENMFLKEGVIPVFISWCLLFGLFDVFFFAFVNIKHYVIMVNDTFYFCGQNIFDGAQVLKERKLKKAYLPYATGDKETIYLNKTALHDLLFGVFSTSDGNKIVVFYYIEKDYDWLVSDEAQNNRIFNSKYHLTEGTEIYNVIQIENGKFMLERLCAEYGYYSDKLGNLSTDFFKWNEDIEFSSIAIDQYDTEDEAKKELERIIEKRCIDWYCF